MQLPGCGAAHLESRLDNAHVFFADRSLKTDFAEDFEE